MVITAEMVVAGAMAIQQQFANRSGKAAPFEKLPDRMQRQYAAEAEACLHAALGGHHD